MDSSPLKVDLEKAAPEAVPPYQVYDAPDPVLVDDTLKKKLRRRRFRHFVVCTMLILGALHIFGKSGFEMPDLSSIVPHMNAPVLSTTGCHDNAVWKKSVTASGSEFPYLAETSLELPPTANVLSFLSDGAYAHGSITVYQPCHTGVQNASVDIRVSYHDEEALDDAIVCGTRPSGEEWGLGIFTPGFPHARKERTLRFDIRVRLPVAANNLSHSSLDLRSLKTNLPNFEHHIHALAETVHFEEVVLKASNAQVQVDLLAASTVSIETSAKPIRGTFNTSSSLVLSTSNAEISIRANLFSDGAGIDSPTLVHMHTSNGQIDSQVGLYSTADSSEGGSFHVIARTSNAPLALSFPDAPLQSHLDVHARTSNQQVTVNAHKAYEGVFALRTSNALPEVKWDEEVEDPAGKGRERKVEIRHVGGNGIRGTTVWEGEPRGKGMIGVWSTNKEVVLNL